MLVVIAAVVVLTALGSRVVTMLVWMDCMLVRHRLPCFVRRTRLSIVGTSGIVSFGSMLICVVVWSLKVMS